MPPFLLQRFALVAVVVVTLGIAVTGLSLAIEIPGLDRAMTSIGSLFGATPKVVPLAETPPSLTFAIGGDVMLGRAVSQRYFKQGFYTSLVDKLDKSIFRDVDVAIVNLEGAIMESWRQEPVASPSLIFRFPREVIDLLRSLHIDAVSLANNHSANGGVKGLAYTRAILEKSGIVPIGGPTKDDVTLIGRFESKTGFSLVVIGVHALVRTSDISALIKSHKKDPKTRVIIMPHWGAEYQAKHGKAQEKLARQWIDAGADLVIGAHPHVIQDIEVYQGKPIVYSLGNLIFDQYFSRATQEGLIVTGEFTEQGLELMPLPVTLVRSQSALMTGSRKTAVLDQLFKGVDRQYRHESSRGRSLFFPIKK